MSMNDILNEIYSAGLRAFNCRDREYKVINARNLDQLTHIGIEITTGGYSGGNCWDDSSPEHYSSDETIDTDDIFMGLEKQTLPRIIGKKHFFDLGGRIGVAQNFLGLGARVINHRPSGKWQVHFRAQRYLRSSGG